MNRLSIFSFFLFCRSLLVAACEKKSILMFDPLCRRLIHAVDNAHRDCVNCVRSVDNIQILSVVFLIKYPL